MDLFAEPKPEPKTEPKPKSLAFSPPESSAKDQPLEKKRKLDDPLAISNDLDAQSGDLGAGLEPEPAEYDKDGYGGMFLAQQPFEDEEDALSDYAEEQDVNRIRAHRHPLSSDDDEDDEEEEDEEDDFDEDHPLANPFTLLERQELKERARSLGFHVNYRQTFLNQYHTLLLGFEKFLEEQLESGTHILKLFHAFDFDLPRTALELPVEAQWTIFAGCLRKFCNVRYKLPHVNTLEDAVTLIQQATKIVVLTGAGISVSCGIPDFRSERGLYSIIAEKYPELDDPQLMFDIHFFQHDPRPFFTLAKEIYPTNFRPSATHMFIRKLQDSGVLLRNYTQNIDTLEKAAGIQKVVHCHGSFDTATCLLCKQQVDGDTIRDLILDERIPMCPTCRPEGSPKISDYMPPALLGADEDAPPDPIMKPDIVFFGEKLPDLFDRQIELDRLEADLMIVIGSSLKVAPVSDLVGFLPHPVPVLLVNREPVYHMHHSFDVQLLGYCDGIIQDLCRRLSWNDIELITESTSSSESEPVVEHVEPNVYLYEGALFDRQKHERILAGDEYSEYTDSSSDSEDEPGQGEHIAPNIHSLEELAPTESVEE